MSYEKYATKKGEKRYIARGVYLGICVDTGKQIRTNLRGKTENELDLKIKLKKAEMQERREKMLLEEIAEVNQGREAYYDDVKTRSITASRSRGIVTKKALATKREESEVVVMTPNDLKVQINELAKANNLNKRKLSKYLVEQLGVEFPYEKANFINSLLGKNVIKYNKFLVAALDITNKVISDESLYEQIRAETQQEKSERMSKLVSDRYKNMNKKITKKVNEKYQIEVRYIENFGSLSELLKYRDALIASDLIDGKDFIVKEL
ncbi:MAG: hypothetical protein LBV67_07160 [Streptococcaceae bacterium]|jgi:hypothetical protein|nr:hypothetical protein [Streptococcaceae bacterium]